MPARPIEEMTVGADSPGMLRTPAEFDALQDFDEGYQYELIHGVLVVSPIPLETGPNAILGYRLLVYKHSHPEGAALDDTLSQQYVPISTGRRLADRLIWTGLGRVARPKKDKASIAVELVSRGKRNRAVTTTRRNWNTARPDLKSTGSSTVSPAPSPSYDLRE